MSLKEGRKLLFIKCLLGIMCVYLILISKPVKEIHKFFLQRRKQELETRYVTSAVCTLSRVWLSDPMDCSRQAPLCMEFSRPEYCSGLPFFSSGIFPTQGSNPPLLRFLCHLGSPCYLSHKGNRWQNRFKLLPVWPQNSSFCLLSPYSP